MSGCHVPYIVSNITYSQPSFGDDRQCPCHLSTWMGIHPPQCYCICNKTVVVNPTPIIYQFGNTKMEEKIKLLEERLAVVESWKKGAKLLCDQSKKPHRCPVCTGEGKWELLSCEETATNHGNRFKTCHGCEGKGIVWG